MMMSIKKALAALFAVCLILSCIPGVPCAYAQSPVTVGGVGYDDLADAFDAAGSGDRIEIRGDVAVNRGIRVEKNVILYSDGEHFVSSAGSLSGPAFEISGGGTLTVTGRPVFRCASAQTFFSVAGGTLTVRDGVCFSSCGTAVSVRSGVCQINGGRFSGCGTAVRVFDGASGFRMSGAVSFGKNDIISLPDGGRIFITDELSGSGRIPVSIGEYVRGMVIAELSSNAITLSEDQAARFIVVFPDGAAETSFDGMRVTVADRIEEENTDTSGTAGPGPGPEVYEAKTGETYYNTLADALGSVPDGSTATVTLLTDVTVGGEITLSGTGRITLVSEGDHKLIRSAGFTGGSILTVGPSSVLTVGRTGGRITLSGGQHASGKPLIRCLGALTLGQNVTVTGGVNTAADLSDGGTVSVPTGGILRIDGAQIVNNSAKAGGGVMISGGSVFFLSGTVVSNKAQNGGGFYLNGGMLTMNGGRIADNTAEADGGAVYCSGSFELSGAASVPGTGERGENDVYLASGRTVSVGGAWEPSEGPVNVTPASPEIGTRIAVFSDASRAAADRFALTGEAADAFSLAADGGAVVVSEKAEYAAYIGETPYATLADAIGAVPEDGTPAVVTLVRDVLLDGTLTVGSGRAVTLTVGSEPGDETEFVSRAVSRAEGFNGGFFTVEEGASLTLAGTEEKLLVIDGAGVPSVSSLVTVAGVLTVSEGTVITGGYASEGEDLAAEIPVLLSGGGITVSATGVFEMTGGSVENNYAAFGGGVFVSDGTFRLSGGFIRGNKALYGAGVYISNTLTADNVSEPEPLPPGTEPEPPHGVMEMTGGSVIENSALPDLPTAFPSGEGGGIYIGNAAELSLSGGTVERNAASLGAGVYVGTVRQAEEEPVRVPVFKLSGTASFAENEVYLTLPDESVVTVTGVPNGLGPTAPLVIDIPSLLAQNTVLVRYAIDGFSSEQNEHAAQSAIGAGWYALFGEAAQFYKPGTGPSDGALILNVVDAPQYLRYAAGREYNGLPEFEDAGEDGAGGTAVEYCPIEIFPGGCFTLSFEMSYYVNLYTNMRASLVGRLPEGTLLTLISFADPEHPQYYFYEVNGTEEIRDDPGAQAEEGLPGIIAVPLNSFVLMKDGRTHFGEYAEGENPSADRRALLRECFTVAVDLPETFGEEGVALAGDFTLSVEHAYPGETEGVEYDISANFKKVEYSIAECTGSEVMAVADGEGVTVSCVLGENSRILASDCGLILLELAQGVFPDGTVASVGDRYYPAAASSGRIVVPMLRDEQGHVAAEGSVRIGISNYYGSAVIGATLTASVYPSFDGLHIMAGEECEAVGAGIPYTLVMREEWSLSVTDGSGKKPSFEFKKNEPPESISVTVRAERDGDPVLTVRLKLEDSDYDYRSIPLSTVFSGFDDTDGKGADVIIGAPLILIPKNGAPRGEYRLAFTAGDKTEYVRIVIK